VTCPNGWEACDLFASVYKPKCPAAFASLQDGGLLYNLVADGWETGSCGPNFCLNFNDTCQNNQATNAVVQQPDTPIHFEMVYFHKQILGGEAYKLPELVSDPSMYFTFFVKEGRVCGGANAASQELCEAKPGSCKWDANRQEQCYFDFCPLAVKPPASACTKCDAPSGYESKDCTAPKTEITSQCNFHLPACGPQ